MNDYILNDTGDLKIEGGDFAVAESIQQETKLLLISKKGEWKNQPLVGANIQQYLKQREGITDAIREGKIQLKNDGKIVNYLRIEGNKISVDTD